MEEARNRQYDRYGKEICNSMVAYDVLVKKSPLAEGQKRALQQFSQNENWSNRKQIKIIRLARTISDLQASTLITDDSIWKAMKLNGKPDVKTRSLLV